MGLSGRIHLNAKRSEILDDLINYFQTDFAIDVVTVDYEFQKGGNEMLTIRRKSNAVA
jgi:hypothetical protein